MHASPAAQTACRTVCPRCCRLTVQAVDGVCLRRGTQWVLLRRDRLADWPAFRCPHCDSADVAWVENLD